MRTRAKSASSVHSFAAHSATTYACPNLDTRDVQARLNIPVPTSMRGPGEAQGNFALESALDELAHAIALSNHIDYLGGMPTVIPQPVKTSEKNEDMLRFDLENEKVTIANYRRRIKQCDELNEFAIGESIREILMQEQDHLIALATALGIDPPNPGIAD